MGLISNGTTIFDAGAMSAGFGGNMTFIKKLTSDGSDATLSFVDGASDVVLDNTYKEYLFIFNDIHPETDNVVFQFNVSIDGGDNYNIAKTTTIWRAYHNEAGDSSTFTYDGVQDLAQGTGFQTIVDALGNDNDQSVSGSLTLFDPSSTTFVKHFLSTINSYYYAEFTFNYYIAGYGNTTSAVDAIQFKMSSGNIDSGDICLYGLTTWQV